MKKEIEGLVKTNEKRIDNNFSSIGKVEKYIIDIRNTVNNNSIITDDNHKRIDKLEQSYFTAGNGIVILDNRNVGMDTIDISVDPNLLNIPKIDLMEQHIFELQNTVKLLSQYIYDNENLNPGISKKTFQ